MPKTNNGMKAMAANKKKAMGDAVDAAPEGVPAEMPESYGAKVMRRFHEDHSILMKDYDAMMPLLDHDHVKRFLTKRLEGMEEALGDAESLFSKHFKGLPPFKSLDDEDPGVVMDDELEDVAGGDIEEEHPEALEEVPEDLPAGLDDEDGEEMPVGDLDEAPKGLDDAVPADSVDDDHDELPSGEEVATSMGVKSRGKAWHKSDDADEDDAPVEKKNKHYQLAFRKSSGKWFVKSFDSAKERDDEVERMSAKSHDSDIMTRDPDEDEPAAPAAKALDKDELEEGEKRLIKDASGYLGEVADSDSLDEEKKLKAYYHAKQLEDVADEGEEVAKAMPDKDENGFKVTINGKETYFSTLEEAKKFAEDYRKRTGVILGIEKKAMPGTPEWAEEEAKEPEHKSRRACKDASAFLKALAREKAFGEKHRAAAKALKKELDESLEEEQAVQPGQMGEKSLGSAELTPAEEAELARVQEQLARELERTRMLVKEVAGVS